MSYLEPLFIAYDDKIEKTEATLDIVYDDMQEMSKKSNAIIEENEYLRK